MELEKLCLAWFLLQVHSILTNSSSIVYTIEGSAINLTFEPTDILIRFMSYRNGLFFRKYLRLEEKKYDIRVRPSIIEFQIINVTSNDTGLYWLHHSIPELELTITNKSCQSRTSDHGCAVSGSSVEHTFIFEASVCYEPGEEWPRWRCQHRMSSNVIMHVDLYIYNVILEDDGYYIFYKIFDPIKLQVSKLWFVNQTNFKTIVGHEGEAIEIICSSDTGQYITSLTLESNGTVKAIGDHQTVNYSFIPDRTDHLEKFKCLDSNHSAIMIDVELSIRYAPSVIVRYTNGTIECDCKGVPAVYSVYRLDRISKYGELVYSINLDNGTFVFKTDHFPYQRNGRYMCVVSNGISGTNGKEIQNSSIHVIFEGPPVFAKENTYVKHEKVGQSSSKMSFLVYSCPDVEEVYLQKLGRNHGKKRRVHTYVLKSTVLNNDLDNTTGVPGYDILIEIELDRHDFQAYAITVKNRLGASDFHFEIIKKEDREIEQREKKYVFAICIIAAVLFGSIIIHVGCCVKCARLRVQIHSNMNEDRTYHTYDEIGTIAYGAVINERPSETHDNQGQNLTQQHVATFSNTTYVQTIDNDSNALHADIHNDYLQQRGITGVQEQQMSLSLNETNSIDDREQSSDDSDSESSQTVMVGNVGDGYENPYQSVLLDRPEGHQYTQITIEGNTRISSAESNCEMQILQTSLTKEGGYINLQI